MTGSQVLQSVQFVTVKGKRLAVLSAEDWEAFVEWLEDVEDVQIARGAFERLKAAGGDRRKTLRRLVFPVCRLTHKPSQGFLGQNLIWRCDA